MASQKKKFKRIATARGMKEDAIGKISISVRLSGTKGRGNIQKKIGIDDARVSEVAKAIEEALFD